MSNLTETTNLDLTESIESVCEATQVEVSAMTRPMEAGDVSTETFSTQFMDCEGDQLTGLITVTVTPYELTATLQLPGQFIELARMPRDPFDKLMFSQAGSVIGSDITVIPSVGVGESRDTEAGLQPWDAVLVGISRIGNPIVEVDGYAPREIHGDLLRNRNSGKLQAGRF